MLWYRDLGQPRLHLKQVEVVPPSSRKKCDLNLLITVLLTNGSSINVLFFLCRCLFMHVTYRHYCFIQTVLAYNSDR